MPNEDTNYSASRRPPPVISQKKAYELWRTLVEIGYGYLDAGPTPEYVHEHAKKAVQNVQ